MRTDNWETTFFVILGIVWILGCASITGAPPDISAGEPPGVQATAPLPAQTPTSFASEAAPQPALPERRRMTLEFPPKIRLGDSDLVRLTLEVDDLGNLTPTAQMGGNVVTGEVIEIPNLYESHHVVAEARFDLAGMEIRPEELISEPLAQGNMAEFYWSIRPQATGQYRGTIWLYLRFIHKQTGEESRKTLSAQVVEIEAVNFLGLSGGLARTTGVVGSVVGTVLGFPFLEDIVKFLFRGRNRTRSPKKG
ncbi:MAG: hypothetical protein M3Y68_07350 [Chloroflexota bacterium]|nr:hypothetical protein [Chloroflexota bacterium]